MTTAQTHAAAQQPGADVVVGTQLSTLEALFFKDAVFLGQHPHFLVAQQTSSPRLLLAGVVGLIRSLRD